MGNSRDLADGETRFVNASGDTFTGALTGTSAGFTGDVNIGNNDSSNPLSKLRLGGTQYGAADIRPTDEGGHKVGMAFYTDGTGDTTIDPVLRMTIDSLGRVTMPNQPAFHVGVNANQTLGSGSTVIFQQQFENRGSHYNTSNGIFTAPVTGFYSFTYRLLHEAVSNGFAVDSYISKNNGASAGHAFLSQRYKYQADYTGHTGYLSESSSGMFYLAANDTVRVKYGGAQNSIIHNNQNWSYFCGHLVG